MTNLQKVALTFGTGLIIGAVATVLPTFQLGCFVVGMMLVNYVNVTQKSSK